MDAIIQGGIMVMLIAYVAIAIWMICKRKTILGSIGTSACFIGGGIVIVPLAEAIVTFVIGVVIVGLVLTIIGLVSG